MSSNPTDALTNNKFIDKMLKIVPDNPVYQSQYIYYLTLIIFFGLLGYTIAIFVELFNVFAFRSLFQGIFMAAISLLSLFGLKQSRKNYVLTKSLFNKKENVKPMKEDDIESVEEMLLAFKKKK